MKKLVSMLCAAAMSVSMVAAEAKPRETVTYTDDAGNVYEYHVPETNRGIGIIRVTLADKGVFVTPSEIDGVPVYTIPTGALNEYRDTLKSVTITGNMYMDTSSFSNLETLTFSEGVTEIMDGMYHDCPKLKTINLPDGLVKIGYEMFVGNTSLKTIDIPDSVTKIGEFLFADCSAITEISLPDGLTEIPMGCFSGCTSLKRVKLPASLESIGIEAFKDCINLTEIDIPDGIKIGKDAFLNCPAGNAKNKEAETEKPKSTAAPTEKPTAAPEKGTAAPEQTDTPTQAPDTTEVPETMPAATPGDTEALPLLDVRAGSSGRMIIETDGNPVSFDEDAQPFIDENGRTQIPIRAVAEAMGCEVSWDNDTRTATIKKDNIIIVITIDEASLKVGSETVEMDTTAKIINNRTYIPVRFVGEALGMKVNWKSE